MALGRQVAASCSSSFRCSLVSFCGVGTFTMTCRSPTPRPADVGHAVAAQAERRAGLRALRDRDRLVRRRASAPGSSPPSASVVKGTGISQ